MIIVIHRLVRGSCHSRDLDNFRMTCRKLLGNLEFMSRCDRATEATQRKSKAVTWTQGRVQTPVPAFNPEYG